MPLFTNEERDELETNIYNGLTTVNSLPTNIYIGLALSIFDAAEDGFGLKLTEFSPDDEFTDLLKAYNVDSHKFAAAKTYQQVRAMRSNVFGRNGIKTRFDEYKEVADQIFSLHNETWLEAELVTADLHGLAGKQWVDIQATKDVFPWLEYKTVGDDRVRPTHRERNGVIRRVDDPWWDAGNYPPVDWRCRCGVLQLDNAVETPIPANLPPVDPAFNFNTGIEKKLFGDKHPYYTVPEKDIDLKRRNFGLNLPDGT